MIATVYPDRQALCAGAAERITQLIAHALQTQERATVCLTGGGTARAVYEIIGTSEGAATQLDWARVHFFWGDERDVPAEHPDSNYAMAAATLLTKVPISRLLVHRIPADGCDAHTAARAYEATLQRVIHASTSDHVFDVTLLGIGADAHIASLFPGAAELVTSSARLVVAVPPASTRCGRITLTPAALLDARRILVMASGRDKANAVRTVFSEREDVVRWPAQLLRRADGRVEFLMDSAADGRVRAARPSR